MIWLFISSHRVVNPEYSLNICSVYFSLFKAQHHTWVIKTQWFFINTPITCERNGSDAVCPDLGWALWVMLVSLTTRSWGLLTASVLWVSTGAVTNPWRVLVWWKSVLSDLLSVSGNTTHGLQFKTLSIIQHLTRVCVRVSHRCCASVSCAGSGVGGFLLLSSSSCSLLTSNNSNCVRNNETFIHERSHSESQQLLVLSTHFCIINITFLYVWTTWFYSSATSTQTCFLKRHTHTQTYLSVSLSRCLSIISHGLTLSLFSRSLSQSLSLCLSYSLTFLLTLDYV